MLNEHQLLEAGDRVLVGLSGGKDSMILLEALADRRRHLPFDFQIFAVHVSATNIGYKMDTGYLEEFCDELNIPLYLEEIELDLTVDPKKSPCFICSWHRRKRAAGVHLFGEHGPSFSGRQERAWAGGARSSFPQVHRALIHGARGHCHWTARWSRRGGIPGMHTPLSGGRLADG